MIEEQTQNKHKQHKQTGGFAKGNTIGNRWKKGESGNPNDLNAIKFIVERLEGKALERQERVNKSEPIQVMVIDDG